VLKVELIAVGTRPPTWITQGVEDYVSRMKRQCRFTVREIKTADRRKPQSVSVYKEEEGRGILSVLGKDSRVIAMDPGGQQWSTEQLALKIADWSQMTSHFQFLIGGPDGLSDVCRDKAHETWSLSRLTFPHFLVRLLLSEQIYRALSINSNHPYHR
jgi:23S rRNA (pseudouridine1915-N3)-methyltransferase